ncbi:hypothetical protein BD324DRAFT_291404 [Kockovaella imperatae]|uniref:Uncharacterized protein n=1 Tax=Kockovaella imperatae TaxID=4999 RepID=A0A1Y1UMY9_9TREE|nr:hypothetical protein BD324DRAFT_291404 [Kockovaella imperatae]ORX38816.1 hypothetical protein BD324DRAFT_291404 [Kockovaella imperatae]
MPSISEKRGLPGLVIDTIAASPSMSSPTSPLTGSSHPTPTTPYSPYPMTPSTPPMYGPLVGHSDKTGRRIPNRPLSSRTLPPRFCEVVSEEPREIIMGGLVTRSSTASSRRGSAESQWDEKRIASIEVPGIILTEPHPEPHPRRSSTPPPKSILLLPPTSLPLPDDTDYRTCDPFRIFYRASPGPTASTPKRPSSHLVSILKSIALLGVVGVGAWHLYTSLSITGWTDEMTGLAEELAH